MKEKNKQTNNFDNMWDDEEFARYEPHFKTVEKKLQRTQQTAHVTGEVVDLFFTKIFQVMLRMLGGSSQDSQENGQGAKMRRDTLTQSSERQENLSRSPNALPKAHRNERGKDDAHEPK